MWSDGRLHERLPSSGPNYGEEGPNYGEEDPGIYAHFGYDPADDSSEGEVAGGSSSGPAGGNKGANPWSKGGRTTATGQGVDILGRRVDQQQDNSDDLLGRRGGGKGGKGLTGLPKGVGGGWIPGKGKAGGKGKSGAEKPSYEHENPDKRLVVTILRHRVQKAKETIEKDPQKREEAEAFLRAWEYFQSSRAEREGKIIAAIRELADEDPLGHVTLSKSLSHSDEKG